MQFSSRSVLDRTVSICLIVAGMVLCSTPGQAQGSPLRALAGFFSVGGYFFSDGTAKSALGDTKFYSETAFYGKPKRFNNFQYSGGVDILSASDHFFPFSGGNEFSLTGAGVRITMSRVLGRPRPFFTAGLYAGHVRSEQLGIDRTEFTPSGAVGVEWPFARYFTLTANYRFSSDIGGINANGFSVGLRFF